MRRRENIVGKALGATSYAVGDIPSEIADIAGRLEGGKYGEPLAVLPLANGDAWFAAVNSNKETPDYRRYVESHEAAVARDPYGQQVALPGYLGGYYGTRISLNNRPGESEGDIELVTTNGNDWLIQVVSRSALNSFLRKPKPVFDCLRLRGGQGVRLDGVSMTVPALDSKESLSDGKHRIKNILGAVEQSAQPEADGSPIEYLTLGRSLAATAFTLGLVKDMIGQADQEWLCRSLSINWT